MAKDSISKLRDKKKTKNVNIEHVSSKLVKPFSGKEITESESLRAFIPPLKEEESLLLEQSIREEGVREPLLLWANPEGSHILVDGYNRYRIIKKIEGEGRTVKYGVKYLEFPDLDAVKDWMLQNQLGRRNLTNEQRSYLRGLRYLREKAKHGGDRKSSGQNDPMLKKDSEEQGRFSEFLAKEFGVGEKTIRRDADFAKGLEMLGDVNPTLKSEMLAGRAKIKKVSLQQLGKVEGKKLPAFKDANQIDAFVQKDKNKAVSGSSARKSVKSSPVIQKLFKSAENSLKKASGSQDSKDVAETIKILEQLKKML